MKTKTSHNFIRWVGAIVGTVASWATAVGLPLVIYKIALDLLYNSLRATRITMSAPSELDEMSLLGYRLGDFSLTLSLPSQVSYSWVGEVAIFSLMPFALFIALSYMATPFRLRCRSLFGVAPQAVDKYSQLYAYIKQLRELTGGPRAAIYVLPLQTIQAYAMHRPFRGGAILITNGMLESLAVDEIKWIICHEYAHCYHGDTEVTTFWLITNKTTNLFNALKHKLSKFTLRLFRLIPLLKLLSSVLGLALLVINFLGWIGRKVGTFIYLLFDRHGGRRAEYEADRFASSVMGSDVGVTVLRRLSGDIEPLFNGIFSTHPPLSKRIASLTKHQ